MRLPLNARLDISNEKLLRYLLSPTHPVGHSKAQYFYSLGFTEKNHELLKTQLVTLARFNEIVIEVETRHGVKYIIDGALITTAGRRAFIRTVWIRNRNSDTIRLVTAYPTEKGE